MRSILSIFSTALLIVSLSIFAQAQKPATLNPPPTFIDVKDEILTVNGKQSHVFNISQPNGTFGYVGEKGRWFNVTVRNKTKVPLVLHWHGLIVPNPEDGVPYVTQLPIPPGGSYNYRFPLKQAGTFWFHSHYKLQEQRLMAAPFIIHDANEEKEAEAIMFIQDFTFADPAVIYRNLRQNLQQNSMAMNTMNMSGKGSMDLTDVKFDAYLTNHRTLANPDVVFVKPNQSLRLRIINASASSNYTIDLGNLEGELIAVDGEPIHPILGKRFEIAIGNRLDIRVKIPYQGFFPILALPEGTQQRTGLFLSTEQKAPPQLAQTTKQMNPALTGEQEWQLSAMKPLSAKPIDQTLVYDLEGDMKTYQWRLNGQMWPDVKPFIIKPGTRVAMEFNNKSAMSHPMHFHGHAFQIIELNGKPINGRVGDTINVMPKSSVKVMFDADNPGIWMVHCHILYHQQGGMMTTVNYEGYPDKFTTEQRMEGEKIYQMSH